MPNLHDKRLDRIREYIKERISGKKEELVSYFADDGVIDDRKNDKVYSGKEQLTEYYVKTNGPPFTPYVSEINFDPIDRTYTIELSMYIILATITFSFAEDTELFSRVLIF